MPQQIAIYWLIAQIFGLVGAPLAARLFGALPDRGYAFAKSLGLLLTGYLAWMLAMLGLAPFGVGLVVVCALAVVIVGGLLRGAGGAALGIAALPQRALPDLGALRLDLARWAQRRWRMVLGYELVFGLALVFLALLRAHAFESVGPDPWGTERPMDFAFFNAIRQGGSFPPHDPWLAGYSINYYYMGYLLMACVALLGGQEPSVAYNLSLALIFALAAIGVAGVVYNLVGLSEPTDRRKDVASAVTQSREDAKDEPTDRADFDERQSPSVNRRASIAERQSPSVNPPSPFVRWALICAALVFVLLAGNQAAALQVITGTPMAVALTGPELARAVANGLGPRTTIQLDAPFAGDYFDGASTIQPNDQVAQFNWWNPSRAIWERESSDPAARKRYVITEFPFFSFWLGDMHPHVMALPFALLALALTLQLTAASTRGPVRLAAPDLLLAAIVIGSLFTINSWELPTYLLLALGALALGYRGARFGWRGYALAAAPLLIASFALFLPFYLTVTSLVGGKAALVNLPLLGTISRSLGLVTWDKTPIHSFLIIFGLFLLPLAAYALTQKPEQSIGGIELPDKQFAWRSVNRYLRWGVPVALVAGLALGFPLLFLLPLGIYAMLLAWQSTSSPAQAFVLGAFGLGCLITFGTELIYIRDLFENRMNTVFKFYYQVWLIWGMLAPYALWRLWSAAGQRLAKGDAVPGSAAVQRPLRRLVLPALATVLTAWLLAGALVYPALTAGKSFTEGKLVGLEGKTPRQREPDGAAAIAWLRANAQSSSVILEAVGPAYDTGGLGFASVSASTGLAAVLGWESHQGQWRGGQPEVLEEAKRRAAAVAELYNTTDAARARDLLAQYNVRYVYLGEAERATYAPEGLAKFGQLGSVAFQQGGVTIYQIAP